MRPDLAAARTLVDRNELEVAVTRNGVLPRLDVFITAGRSGYSDSFRRSFGHLDDDTYDVMIGFDLSYFLGRESARGRELRATVSLEQAHAAVRNLRQLIRLDVRLAVNEAERARMQIAATRTTRELKARTWEVEKLRFDAGSSTALLVAQTQRTIDATRAQMAARKAKKSAKKNVLLEALLRVK